MTNENKPTFEGFKKLCKTGTTMTHMRAAIEMLGDDDVLEVAAGGSALDSMLDSLAERVQNHIKADAKSNQAPVAGTLVKGGELVLLLDSQEVVEKSYLIEVRARANRYEEICKITGRSFSATPRTRQGKPERGSRRTQRRKGDPEKAAEVKKRTELNRTNLDEITKAVAEAPDDQKVTVLAQELSSRELSPTVRRRLGSNPVLKPTFELMRAEQKKARETEASSDEQTEGNSDDLPEVTGEGLSLDHLKAEGKPTPRPSLQDEEAQMKAILVAGAAKKEQLQGLNGNN